MEDTTKVTTTKISSNLTQKQVLELGVDLTKEFRI